MIPIIGLMSGTSMDGINATIVETDGKKLKRTNISNVSEYQKQTKSMLLKAVDNPKIFLKDNQLQKQLGQLIAIDHANLINLIIKDCNSKPKFIAFHGQTILHQPEFKTSVQLGDSQLLANLTGINVISDFRQKDILSGGQGAPLAPIYHQNIMQEIGLILPSCLVNIGGVSNITFWDNNKLLGFDTGPGNGLMDIYTQSKLGLPFDNNGEMASKGKYDLKIIEKFENDIFFNTKYPKSLDKFHFIKFYNLVIKEKLSDCNSLATLLELTIRSIKIEVDKIIIFY